MNKVDNNKHDSSKSSVSIRSKAKLANRAELLSKILDKTGTGTNRTKYQTGGITSGEVGAEQVLSGK